MGSDDVRVGIAARYQPATAGLAVGGDWYGVEVLDDGRVGISVGDVAGHGLAAAGAMGGLRSAVDAALFARRVTVSSVGHLPPVLVTPDGGEVCVVPPGPPLGVTSAPLLRPTTELTLPPGSTLVLCTDGLVERRGESLEPGMRRLVEVATSVATEDLESAADAILERLRPQGADADAAALLLVRR